MTQSELKSLLHYDQETGIFCWLKSNGNRKANKIAGTLTSYGYIAIKINKKVYKAHQLAWLYMYGEFPTEMIDHINRIRNDNRIVNLRLATNQQNQFNSNIRKDNTSGIKGVSWNKKANKWMASIRIDKKKTYIGTYDNLEIAKMCLDIARQKYHKDFSD